MTLESGLLPVQADLGIALAVGDAGHGQIHADLGALALEVGAQALDDLLLDLGGDIRAELLADADDVLGSPAHLSLLFFELAAGDLADGAELGGIVALMDVTAYGANPFCHRIDLLPLSGQSLNCILRPPETACRSLVLWYHARRSL